MIDNHLISTRVSHCDLDISVITRDHLAGRKSKAPDRDRNLGFHSE